LQVIKERSGAATRREIIEPRNCADRGNHLDLFSRSLKSAQVLASVVSARAG
jgi:hypothetical protein